MKKITHKCACGAEGSFEDSGKDQDKLITIEKFTRIRGDYREEGLLVERQAYEWLASHAACRQAKSEPIKRGEIAQPVIDRDECEDRRANRADKLAEDCRKTKEEAKEYAKWLANDASAPYLIYDCRVGGEDHWHVEKVMPDLIVSPSVSFLAQEIEAARQQERERILEIVKRVRYQSPSGCCVTFAFDTVQRILIAIKSEES